MTTRPFRNRTDYIVIHCSATPASRDIGAADIDTMHKGQGWQGIGYHFVIRRNGRVEVGEDLKKVGSHVQGFNSVSVGVCMVGGLGKDGKGENNFTPEQWDSLEDLILLLRKSYPEATIVGHRDMSPDLNKDGVVKQNEWMKECPSFSVTDWLAGGMQPIIGKANVEPVPVPKPNAGKKQVK